MRQQKKNRTQIRVNNFGIEASITPIDSVAQCAQTTCVSDEYKAFTVGNQAFRALKTATDY